MKSAKRSFRWIIPNICSLILLAAPETPAAELIGANAVLKKVEAEAAQSPEKKVSEHPHARFREELKRFEAKLPALQPAEAARAWLALVDGMPEPLASAFMHSQRGVPPVQAGEVLLVLPGPAAWKELASAIAQRPAPTKANEVREIALRLLAATLTGDVEGRRREIAALQANAEKTNAADSYQFRNVFQRISQAILASLDDPEAVLKSLHRELAVADEDRYRPTLQVPNLSVLVGREKTEQFLREALNRKLMLSFNADNETARMARKLALEMIDQLKQAQWGLVNSLDSVELYEALVRRFDKPKEQKPLDAFPELQGLPGLDADMPAESEQREAGVYYMLGLIARSRTAEAAEQAVKLGRQGRVYFPMEATKAMERAGYTSELEEFFHALLAKDATLPFWEEYVQLAAKAGRTERMLTLARAAAASDELNQGKKAGIHRMLYRALLAADQVEAGVSEIRRLVELGAVRPTSDETSGDQLGVRLARVGLLLQRPEWIEEGIGLARKSLDRPDRGESYWREESVALQLADLFMELNRAAEAEQVLSDALARQLRSASTGQVREHWNSRQSNHQILVALMEVYAKSNRFTDVVALAEQAPYWDVSDVAELFGPSSMWRISGGEGKASMPALLAQALVAVDRKAEARQICQALLESDPRSDRGYELLLALGERSTTNVLDALFARDQFEERPLIWKAEVLRRVNQLETAERLIRQAIAIDPSDGEQGKGDRMRAYAILAEIRDRRGDQKEADFFRGAVKAIRLAEEADKFYAAGLLKRAVDMYEASLKLFADAYCIQSRLAIQLAEMGLHSEAEAHYRRAYELMPDSFGRVESHCFGCERAFDGERAQNLAEKVFFELAAKRPDKPQVHYLLGYLREEQERYPEALPHFQTAVRLDPDYLNAWGKIAALSQHVRLPASERDEVIFNVLRLDPRRQHSHVAFEQATDLARLWQTIAAASPPPPAPTNLFVLTASKAALEKRRTNQSEPEAMETYERIWGARFEQTTPAAAVSQTPFIQITAQLLDLHLADEE